MLLKFLLLGFSLALFPFVAFSQSSPFLNHHVADQRVSNQKAGELLLSLQPGLDAEKLFAKYPELAAQYDLTTIKQVAKTMNIWLIGHDAEADAAVVLAALYRLPEVQIAQYNHIIKKRDDRKVPNDIFYSDQWQYNNDGSNGGVAGADIDAELAWHITTGGVTPNGDTIVVAIIDDGMDTTMGDMKPNWWKNHNEVPNNNIDDDGNGFIDDYRGWNAYDNDDEIFSTSFVSSAVGWHGSSVAGIVGAKGGDGSGVTGVNWDVDLMIIVGGGDEAEAIAAYDYALQNRKLYDATLGAKGAYVVATNSSWGIDELFYYDAPLWCSFYDSLGKAGIISAGATVNANFDIEVDGDMPTSCPSEYLIAVTNTKRNDEKETQAGYGTLSVDLGAPGEEAYTVEVFSDFAPFGGTSGATPHVAGAIALLFSVPNQEFADYTAGNPDSAGLWVKRFILEGVDANTSLANKSVTEGRLNLFGAIEKMYEYFPDEEPDTNVTIGIGDFWMGNISIYPNPTSAEVVVQLPSSEAVIIRVLGMDGKVYFYTQPAAPARFHHVSLVGMATGVYILEVTSPQGEKSYHRVIKQ